jgi:hypothetical protein
MNVFPLQFAKSTSGSDSNVVSVVGTCVTATEVLETVIDDPHEDMANIKNSGSNRSIN